MASAQLPAGEEEEQQRRCAVTGLEIINLPAELARDLGDLGSVRAELLYARAVDKVNRRRSKQRRVLLVTAERLLIVDAERKGRPRLCRFLRTDRIYSVRRRQQPGGEIEALITVPTEYDLLLSFAADRRNPPVAAASPERFFEVLRAVRDSQQEPESPTSPAWGFRPPSVASSPGGLEFETAVSPRTDLHREANFAKPSGYQTPQRQLSQRQLSARQGSARSADRGFSFFTVRSWSRKSAAPPTPRAGGAQQQQQQQQQQESHPRTCGGAAPGEGAGLPPSPVAAAAAAAAAEAEAVLSGSGQRDGPPAGEPAPAAAPAPSAAVDQLFGAAPSPESPQEFGALSATIASEAVPPPPPAPPPQPGRGSPAGRPPSVGAREREWNRMIEEENAELGRRLLQLQKAVEGAAAAAEAEAARAARAAGAVSRERARRESLERELRELREQRAAAGAARAAAAGAPRGSQREAPAAAASDSDSDNLLGQLLRGGQRRRRGAPRAADAEGGAPWAAGTRSASPPRPGSPAGRPNGHPRGAPAPLWAEQLRGGRSVSPPRPTHRSPLR
eukprot:TRINITY_DN11161_c0_g1_i1.p1 TRINITY_DN11161_c0_g1~~TRINITY_DN11161_c0_g1_i1.p1  ORF type:complete len:586 (+),score=211.22 TRINITY_DN11161_c0_g1_i1:77-1759(+)